MVIIIIIIIRFQGNHPGQHSILIGRETKKKTSYLQLVKPELFCPKAILAAAVADNVLTLYIDYQTRFNYTFDR